MPHTLCTISRNCERARTACRVGWVDSLRFLLSLVIEFCCCDPARTSCSSAHARLPIPPAISRSRAPALVWINTTGRYGGSALSKATFDPPDRLIHGTSVRCRLGARRGLFDSKRHKTFPNFFEVAISSQPYRQRRGLKDVCVHESTVPGPRYFLCLELTLELARRRRFRQMSESRSSPVPQELDPFGSTQEIGRATTNGVARNNEFDETSIVGAPVPSRAPVAGGVSSDHQRARRSVAGGGGGGGKQQQGGGAGGTMKTRTVADLRAARESRANEALKMKDEQLRILQDQNNQLLRNLDRCVHVCGMGKVGTCFFRRLVCMGKG